MRPSPILLTHFSVLLLPQLSCIILYNILFIKHFAAEMLPLAFFFFNFKLSKFIVCYGVYSNVFLSIFSPIPSPPWTHLRRLEKCLNIHTAACSSCLFTGLGKQDMFPFFKKPIDNYNEILLLLYHSAFCFSLVSFKKFQQQSCYSVGTMDYNRCLELCIPVPAVNFIVLCWMIF